MAFSSHNKNYELVKTNVKMSGLCLKCKKEHKLGAVNSLQSFGCVIFRLFRSFQIMSCLYFLSRDSFPLLIGCKSSVFPMNYITTCSHFLNQKMLQSVWFFHVVALYVPTSLTIMR